MRSILFIFCILVLSSVSHISGQSCTTNEQCTDPVAAPLCRNGTCGTCNESAPAECLARSPNSPICSSGGCYPCISTGDYATECGQLYPATPICSNDTGACRACAADSECTIYGETMHCQNGSCVGLSQNEGLIIAVCFIAAIVAVIIALILYSRLRKKKDKKKGATSTNNAANNANNNSANNNNNSTKTSARGHNTNKDVPMTEIKKEPVEVDGNHNDNDSSAGSSVSSSSSKSASEKSASAAPASSEESSEDEESAEDSSESSESSSQSSSEDDNASNHESSAQSSSK